MVGWHHQLKGHKFEQTPGDSEGQESQALQSMGSQRVRRDVATEQQQKQQQEYKIYIFLKETMSDFKEISDLLERLL